MTGLNHARRDGILSYVARSLGLSSVDVLIDRAVTSPFVPAVCVECYTVSDTHKIGLRDGWCSCCHGQHVKSVLVVGEVL
jgi:hypothetical protein